MNKFYVAPQVDDTEDNIGRRIFLAGTIDMGNSSDWQNTLISRLSDDRYQNLNITIYNPRRDKEFNVDDQEEQIRWELNHLDKADVILVNILPDSKSPITLMEIGLYANSGKLVVVCPKEFYRYDNVRIVCEKYNIPLYNLPGQVKITNLIKK